MERGTGSSRESGMGSGTGSNTDKGQGYGQREGSGGARGQSGGTVVEGLNWETRGSGCGKG